MECFEQEAVTETIAVTVVKQVDRDFRDMGFAFLAILDSGLQNWRKDCSDWTYLGKFFLYLF